MDKQSAIQEAIVKQAFLDLYNMSDEQKISYNQMIDGCDVAVTLVCQLKDKIDVQLGHEMTPELFMDIAKSLAMFFAAGCRVGEKSVYQ